MQTNELMFTDAYVLIFARSFGLAFLTTILCLIIGYPVALDMTTGSTYRKNMLVYLFSVPSWSNLLIRVLCWVLILRDSGLINSLLLRLTVISSPIQLLYTHGAILLGMVYTFIPLMILPLYSSLERIDGRFLEAASDLYANRAQLILRIIFPLSWPGVIAGSLLVFIPSLGTYTVPALLGGDKKLLIGNLIQMQFGGSRNWPFGSACSVVVITLVLLPMLVYYFASRTSNAELKEQ